MVNHVEASNNYIFAEGPEGLKQALHELLQRVKTDPASHHQKHVILYHLNQQKSQITIDTTHSPFQFSHQDNFGRRASLVIKKVIAEFLWEECGEKEHHPHLDFDEYLKTELIKEPGAKETYEKYGPTHFGIFHHPLYDNKELYGDTPGVSESAKNLSKK